jgi:clathrin heavy chain
VHERQETHSKGSFVAYLTRLTAPRVWKQVHGACLEKEEFRLAQICGLNIIVHAEELNKLLKDYEWRGYFSEAIALLEAGLSLERAHVSFQPLLSFIISDTIADGCLH